MNVRSYMQYTLAGLSVGMALGTFVQMNTSKKIDAVEKKIETVDSTLKSWDAAMKPMVMEANAKKLLIMQNIDDSIATVADKPRIEAMQKLLKQLKSTLK